MVGSIMRWVGVLVLGFAIGCDPSPQTLSLIDHDSWTLLEPSEDPAGQDFLDAPLCSPGAYRVEGSGDDKVFEVDTGLCNYIAIGQPALAGMSRGDTLTWSMWHLPLVAEQPAEAYVAIFIDGRRVWDLTSAIPAGEAAYSETLTAEFDAVAGSPVVIHLNNHGSNSWRFHRLLVTHE